MISPTRQRMDVQSFQGLPSSLDTRVIPHMIPLSYDEIAVGHRIHDALKRSFTMAACTSMQVFYKSGLLTLDWESSSQHRTRVVLGPDNTATFMEYALEETGKRIIVPTHMADSEREKELETLLVQTKLFALRAQRALVDK